MGWTPWMPSSLLYFPFVCSCELETDVNGTRGVCKWDHNGQGLQYEMLAGPVFIVVYTLAGIPLSILADFSNRRNLLIAGLTLWSAMTLLTGFVQRYWQLVVTRFLLGIGYVEQFSVIFLLIKDTCFIHSPLVHNQYRWVFHNDTCVVITFIFYNAAFSRFSHSLTLGSPKLCGCPGLRSHQFDLTCSRNRQMFHMKEITVCVTNFTYTSLTTGMRWYFWDNLYITAV